MNCRLKWCFGSAHRKQSGVIALKHRLCSTKVVWDWCLDVPVCFLLSLTAGSLHVQTNIWVAQEEKLGQQVMYQHVFMTPFWPHQCHRILKWITVPPQCGQPVSGPADSSAPAEWQRSAQRAAVPHPGPVHDWNGSCGFSRGTAPPVCSRLVELVFVLVEYLFKKKWCCSELTWNELLTSECDSTFMNSNISGWAVSWSTGRCLLTNYYM